MKNVTAAVARERNAPLILEQLRLDEIRDNEVRVRMVASGICHADAFVRDGIYPTPLPAVLGHEGSGIVEEVGRAVSRVRPGDHVVLSVAYCTQCSECLAGNMAYCENLFAEDFGGRRGDGSTSLSTRDGSAVSSHFFGQSAFSTYANVVESSVVPVSASAPLEIFAPLGCGMQTGAGAVLNELRPQVGSSFAVSGAGAVGLAAIMAARLTGCTAVIAVDVHDSRLELAQEVGATHTINGKDTDVPAELMRITAGRGANYILDTTGLPTVLAPLVRAQSVRGTLALVGSAPSGTEVPFEIGDSLVKGWTFKTIIQGSSVPQLFIPRMADLWAQGRFPFDKLIKHYEFADINAAFADSSSGATVKPVIVF
ncbi:NAD(P)-dependent alcohol dehydrogenase [Amycolatopsis sp. H20-H5]|uniref:NAD(P)-dependent alcohol dehydrogenase n=1 Tax=Amycolatopsis sp. H20-H5 TaxID=3046309 RepID=UPI002DBCD237|nr:NAD(P)-dependent alcohol dehydrogenase [Amycolatopsis sp. H20-H5]MEC3974461.1 NAD(P)-dependent alcohol dehydrogenase [Amycolatopsis sp. H20-H5]